MLRQIASTVSILVVFAFATAVAEQAGPRQRPVSGQLPQTSAGQRPTKAGPPLTLDAALTEALANNPELIALRRQFEAARERPAQERFLAAPTFEAQIWQWPINTLNPANTNMYMFMFGQDIPGPGKRRLREAVVQKDVELAATDIAVRARHVVDQVKRAYAELFLARKAIEVHHASVDLLRQLADVAQAKYTTGRISQQDVLKAVVELSRVHDHLITLDEQAQLAEAQLNTLLDRPPAAAVGPLAEPRERLLLPSAETLQQLAVQHQPELTMVRLGAERADAQLAVVNHEYQPDFFAMGGYMLMPNDRDAWMAKIGVTWPTAPWSRGRLDARRAEATAEIAAAKARVRAVENALRLAVQQAYVRVKSAEQRTALLRTTIVPQAVQTLEVSRVAYQTDRVDFLAIIDNERVRLDAQLDYFRALSDLEQALADLERALGTDIVPSMLAAVNAQGEQ
jgi:outer membrane protein TolC